MIPAPSSKRLFELSKLLVIHDDSRIEHSSLGQLPDHLREGDLLIANSSGTMPSSFQVSHPSHLHPFEIRLASFRGATHTDFSKWSALIFGSGDWRRPTEHRGEAPRVRKGDRLKISDSLTALVTQVREESYRLIELEFESKTLIEDLYQHGRPIQYSYLKENLELWDQQTLFSGPPISVEAPSSAFQLNWKLLFALKEKGVRIAPVLHSAGISSSGDPELDRKLPLEEYYEVPEKTLEAIFEARKNKSRIIALGTTVARALESAFERYSARGYTYLKIGPHSRLKVIDAIITGMHEDGTSHAELMKAFHKKEILSRAEKEAHDRQYRSHEYGDLTLLERVSE